MGMGSEKHGLVCFYIKDWCEFSLTVLLSPGIAKTRNKMRVAIESGKGMKVKVVKLC